MLSTADCKFVIGEIRNRAYYAEMLKQFDDRLEELDRRLESSSMPSSSWVDVVVRNRDGSEQVVREKLRGHGKSIGEKVIDIVMEKEPVEKDKREFTDRKRRADGYYNDLLKDDEWRGFVEAFFDEEQYGKLSTEYAVGNPYRQICRIITNNIRRI